ncbi:MAG TPA: hypothetical protein VIP46_20200, partial [Pyrinomonadaceae bacterium]
LACAAIGCGPASVGVGQLLVAPPTVDTNGDGIVDAFYFGPGNPFGLPTTPGFLAPLAVTTRTAGGPANDRITLFGGNGVRVFRNDSDQHTVNAKIDYNVTDRDSVVVSYNFDRQDFPEAGVGRSVGGFFLDFVGDSNKIASTYRRTLSGQTINEARFNYSRLNARFGNVDERTPPEIGFGGIGPFVLDPDFNIFNFGLSTFGTPTSFPQSRIVSVYQFQDTLTHTRGNHGIKFGADITRSVSEDFLLFNFLGSFTFSGSLSSFNTGGTRPNNTFFEFSTGLDLNAFGIPGLSFENFLLNRPRSVSFALGDPRREVVQNDFFFFAQDDWRVRPNLTLNFGMRYQVSSQPFNSIIGPVNAREADPATAIFNTAFPLELRTAREIPVDTNNFGPHVGFAYSPNFGFLGDRFRDGRTVLRGNFNVTYDSSFFNIVNFTATAAPFAGVGTIVQTRPGSAGSIRFPDLPSTPAQLALTPGTRGGDPRLFDQSPIAPNFHNPYTLAWSFGVQQELFKNTVLEVRYVGNHAVGQFQLYNSNPRVDFLNEAGRFLFNDPGRFTNGIIGQPDLTPAGAAAGNGNGRVNRDYGLVTTTGNGAQSIYHGMQVRFDTRFNRYLTGGANYSFSRTIDNVSEIVPAASNLNNSQNPLDLGAGERGLSAFHAKHVFSGNVLYELPFYREQRGFLGKLLGGYQVNTIVLARSGRPYTPFQAFSTFDPSFNSSLRPYNGNPDAPTGTVAFSAFAAPLIGIGTEVPAGNFIIFDTRNPGTPGRVVTAAQAFSEARLVYNDFGLLALLEDDPRGAVEFYNPEAFLIARSPYGIGRNTFFGDTFATVNASIFKTTRVGEGKSLEFRVEAFNLLNHRNFGIPDPIVEDAYDGTISSSFQNLGFNNGGNRTVRFGLRFLF